MSKQIERVKQLRSDFAKVRIKYAHVGAFDTEVNEMHHWVMEKVITREPVDFSQMDASFWQLYSGMPNKRAANALTKACKKMYHEAMKLENPEDVWRCM